MIQYKILSSKNDKLALQKEVNDYLSKGWNLRGGLIVKVIGQGNSNFLTPLEYFYQVMEKEKSS